MSSYDFLQTSLAFFFGGKLGTPIFVKNVFFLSCRVLQSLEVWAYLQIIGNFFRGNVMSY